LRAVIVAFIAVLTLMGVTVPAGLAASSHGSTGPLVVWSRDGKDAGQSSLTSPINGIDFTWTGAGCAGGYEDPGIVVLRTQKGKLVTRKAGGDRLTPERPILVPCITAHGVQKNGARGHVANGADILIVISSSGIRICYTYNGRVEGDCLAIGGFGTEIHVFLYGGSVVSGARLASGHNLRGNITALNGSDQIDIYPRGKIVPYLATQPGRARASHNEAEMGTWQNAGAPHLIQTRSSPSNEEFDLGWIEQSCGASDDLAPVVVVPAVETAVPPRNGRKFEDESVLGARPYLVPCISKLASSTGHASAKPVRVDIAFNLRPFQLAISFNNGIVGGFAVEVSEFANMAAAFNYNSRGRTAAGHAWNNPHFTDTALWTPGTPGFSQDVAMKTKNTNLTDVYVF
jgi:hypothetical protein